MFYWRHSGRELLNPSRGQLELMDISAVREPTETDCWRKARWSMKNEWCSSYMCNN